MPTDRSPIDALPEASRRYGDLGPISDEARYGMAVDTERCIGCWSCAVICKSENDVPLGMWWNRILTAGEHLDRPERDGADHERADLDGRASPKDAAGRCLYSLAMPSGMEQR